MAVGAEHHLMRLQWVSPHQERPAVQQLDLCYLQFDPFAADVGPVLAPLKLEGFARQEHQKHIGPATRRLFCTLPIFTPCPGKSCHSFI